VKNVKFWKTEEERLILITPNSLTSNVTHYSLGGHDSVPVRGKNFIFSTSDQCMNLRVFGTMVNSVWNWTSTSFYILIVWCLLKKREIIMIKRFTKDQSLWFFNSQEIRSLMQKFTQPFRIMKGQQNTLNINYYNFESHSEQSYTESILIYWPER
jgi:hypothetical protein